MIPTGISTAIAFVLFIVPGLLWELLYERRNPELNESAFREASRVALISTPFSVVAIGLVLSFTAGLNQNWIGDLSNWIISGKPASGEAITVLALVTVAELGVASLLVAILWWRLADELYGPKRTILRRNAWDVALGDRSAATEPFATVRTSDGYEFRGKVLGYSNDIKMADREISLGTPIASRKLGGAFVAMTETNVIIAAANIIAISSLYVPKTALGNPGPPLGGGGSPGPPGGGGDNPALPPGGGGR